jgi:hypothetical protein
MDELRLGPTTTEKGKEIALKELQEKLNEIIRVLNELLL